MKFAEQCLKHTEEVISEKGGAEAIQREKEELFRKAYHQREEQRQKTIEKWVKEDMIPYYEAYVKPKILEAVNRGELRISFPADQVLYTICYEGSCLKNNNYPFINKLEEYLRTQGFKIVQTQRQTFNISYDKSISWDPNDKDYNMYYSNPLYLHSTPC